jgi:hypothetical protein
VTYLTVRKLAEFQHPDILKKSKGKPPWVKLYETFWEDYDLNERQRPATRILALRLLNLASRMNNLVPLDERWLASKASLTRPDVKRGVSELLATGWLAASEGVANASLNGRPLDTDTEGEREKPTPFEHSLRADEEFEKQLALTKLMPLLRDSNERTEGIIRALAAKLPVASLHSLKEQLENRHDIESPAGYVVGALKAQIKERT